MQQEQPLSYRRIASASIMPSPAQIEGEISLSPRGRSVVESSRERASNIVHMRDKGFLLIGGPCCAEQHDPVWEFAERFGSFPNHPGILRIMRACVVKPRTDPQDYKGPFYDHEMNGASDPLDALHYCRQMLAGIVNRGMPVGLELLDQVGLPHLSDTVTFGWLGARDSGGNIAPAVLSGMSAVCGVKNPLNGDIEASADAILKASFPQMFLGIDHQTGINARLQTRGNGDVALILRGSSKGPNYSAWDIGRAVEILDKKGFGDVGVIVDCSHGNSSKNPDRQIEVVREILNQKKWAPHADRIVGAMIESYLLPGSQKVPKDRSGFHVSKIVRGQSVVDPCIGINAFREIYDMIASSLG